MRIIARSALRDFWEKHVDVEQQLKSWFKIVEAAKWQSPQDIKNVFSTADFLPNNRIVFDIKGNKYRLIVAVKYEYQIVYIRFIGTHVEYDKIDAIKI